MMCSFKSRMLIFNEDEEIDSTWYGVDFEAPNVIARGERVAFIGHDPDSGQQWVDEIEFQGADAHVDENGIFYYTYLVAEHPGRWSKDYSGGYGFHVADDIFAPWGTYMRKRTR